MLGCRLLWCVFLYDTIGLLPIDTLAIQSTYVPRHLAPEPHFRNNEAYTRFVAPLKISRKGRFANVSSAS